MRPDNLYHSVFFELIDSSESSIENFIGDCRTYLSGEPGIVSFAVATRVEEHTRDVNMTDYHVSLHVVFETKKDHDAYQACASHNTFVERNSDNWGTVRVYDSYIR